MREWDQVIRGSIPLFSLALLLLASDFISASEMRAAAQDRCTFSKWPILSWVLSCRASTEAREAALRQYWESEDDAELCHYFYFPIADPSASEALLMTNYTIMAKEIDRREVDCLRDHRNIFWYRGRHTRSMLDKYRQRLQRP